MHKTNATTGFPSVITIFSAPNYCDVYNNKGAILKFDNSTLNILQFNCTPHPYHLPNFMDVFTWSMPFVIEKITEMLYFILNPEDDTGGEEELPDVRPMPMTQRKSLSEEQNKAVKLAFELACSQAGEMTRIGSEDGDDNARERMRNKVRTIGRMARMFKTLRQENETIVKLKGVCPGHKLPAGLLLQGKDRLSTELDHFENATELDHDNERRPEGESSSPKHTRSSATLDADDLDDGTDMIAPTISLGQIT
jgi:serine/threonine-protein phosphatase 2B catalytic subunit